MWFGRLLGQMFKCLFSLIFFLLWFFVSSWHGPSYIKSESVPPGTFVQSVECRISQATGFALPIFWCGMQSSSSSGARVLADGASIAGRLWDGASPKSTSWPTRFWRADQNLLAGIWALTTFLSLAVCLRNVGSKWPLSHCRLCFMVFAVENLAGERYIVGVQEKRH